LRAHLIGDFSVVIWDARRHECICARDAVGLKPLYYYLDDRLFVCGSELRGGAGTSGRAGAAE
jgi:asparagine synthase (glutamine-hydrolysing)